MYLRQVAGFNIDIDIYLNEVKLLKQVTRGYQFPTHFASHICQLQMTYFLGAVVFLGGCDWLWVNDIGHQVYGAAVLLGAGGSTVLVSSLSMTADLIGQNTVSYMLCSTIPKKVTISPHQIILWSSCY